METVIKLNFKKGIRKFLTLSLEGEKNVCSPHPHSGKSPRVPA